MHKTLQNRIDSMQIQIKKQMDDMTKIATLSQDPRVVNICEILSPVNENSDFVSFDMMYNSRMLFSFYMYDLDGFKSDRLVEVLEKITGAISLFDGEVKTETSDYARGLTRTFKFEIEDVITITITGAVKADSPTCRKVQVGEETKVVPIYEIQCD